MQLALLSKWLQLAWRDGYINLVDTAVLEGSIFHGRESIKNVLNILVSLLNDPAKMSVKSCCFEAASELLLPGLAVVDCAPCWPFFGDRLRPSAMEFWADLRQHSGLWGGNISEGVLQLFHSILKNSGSFL